MASPTFVLTVDAARARIFRIEGDSPRGVPQLVEAASLVHPEARVPESERYSDSNPRSGMGGGGYHTFDDHRRDHELEERRRFAKHIAASLDDLVQLPCRVVACSTHTMHSVLEEAMKRGCKKAQIVWHTAEHTRLTPHELAVALVELGHLERGGANG